MCDNYALRQPVHRDELGADSLGFETVTTQKTELVCVCTLLVT